MKELQDLTDVVTLIRNNTWLPVTTSNLHKDQDSPNSFIKQIGKKSVGNLLVVEYKSSKKSKKQKKKQRAGKK